LLVLPAGLVRVVTARWGAVHRESRAAEDPERDAQHGASRDRGCPYEQNRQPWACRLLRESLAECRAEGRESGQCQTIRGKQQTHLGEFAGFSVEFVLVGAAVPVEEDTDARE
jgi:hypothetical protein